MATSGMIAELWGDAGEVFGGEVVEFFFFLIALLLYVYRECFN